MFTILFKSIQTNTIIIGLSETNIQELQTGKAIFINKDYPEVSCKIVLLYGTTEKHIVKNLEETLGIEINKQVR